MFIWFIVFLNNWWFLVILMVGSLVLIKFILYLVKVLFFVREIVIFKVVWLFIVGNKVFGFFLVIIFFISFGVRGLI